MDNFFLYLTKQYTEFSVHGNRIQIPYYNIADDLKNKGKTIGKFEGKL